MPRHRVTAAGEHTTLHDRKVRAGQRLLLAFHGTGVGDELRALLRVVKPAGFLLEPANLEGPEQARELCRELASLLPSGYPAILAGSPHGMPGTAWPCPRLAGDLDDLSFTRGLGAAMSTEAVALGLNLLLAPDARVGTADAFADQGERVARHVAAWIRGAQDDEGPLIGIGPFPSGCPDAEEGRVPFVEKDISELERVDLLPFRAAIHCQVPVIQVVHAIFPAWDDTRPATASWRILVEVLREGLGFSGLILGGELSVPFLRERESAVENHQVEALRAGVDLHPCHGGTAFQVACFEHQVRLQEEDTIQDLCAEDSAARLRKAREAWLPVKPQDLDRVDCLDHRILVGRLR